MIEVYHFQQDPVDLIPLVAWLHSQTSNQFCSNVEKKSSKTNQDGALGMKLSPSRWLKGDSDRRDLLLSRFR
jgi:hypothetical protein